MIVGTLGDETIEAERGKILGLMEPSTVVVSSLDYNLERRRSHFDDKGNYKWPFGLELHRAWRFSEPRTSFKEISSRQFGMDAAQGIVELLPDEAKAILRLPREPVELLASIRARARVEGEEVARRGAAPPPTTARRGTMHMRRASAYTYAMSIDGSQVPAFKIGWAFDWKQRQRQFNQAAMPALGGLHYRTVFRHLWDKASEVCTMEQALLQRFDGFRHRENHEVVSGVTQGELERVWTRYVRKKMTRA